MKLTGKLKEKVEAAETKEEMKDIISRAGMELTDEEHDITLAEIVEQLKSYIIM